MFKTIYNTPYLFLAVCWTISIAAAVAFAATWLLIATEEYPEEQGPPAQPGPLPATWLELTEVWGRDA